MRRLAVAALLIASLAGCRGHYVFDCGMDGARCIRSGMPGMCDPSPLDATKSYCAFPEADCPQGRWDATADSALAGKCVGEEAAGCTTTNDLYAVWGASIDDVWAVGANSTVFHLQGGSTCEVQTNGVPAGVILRAVWGRSATDVFIAGDGVILHSSDRGATWVNGNQPTASQFWSIGGTSATVYAGVEKSGATEAGSVFKSADGPTWTLIPSVPADGSPIAAVWSDGTRTFLGGGGNTPYYSDDGSSWTPTDTGGFSGYITAFGSGAKGVLAFTTGSIVMRLGGTSWTKLFNNGNGGPCGSGFGGATVIPGLAIAVGKVGCIAVSTDDGDTWTASDMYSSSPWPYTADFKGAWTDPVSGHTIIVGSGGALTLDPMLPQ